MATHGAKASYYGDEAALYADPKIRPHYPAALYERLFEFAGPGTTALDVATGTGQCAHHLAQTYEQVFPDRYPRLDLHAHDRFILGHVHGPFQPSRKKYLWQVWAIDGSEEQVKHARPHPRITYRKGLAEDTGLPGNSIDLVTVATALHWYVCTWPCLQSGEACMHARMQHHSAPCEPRFNVPAFYKEARRVLKPGGALAAWCYYHPAIKGHDQANEVLGAFLQKVLGPYSTDVQKHCQQGYRDLEPGSGDFAHCERTSLPFEQESSIRHLVRSLPW